MASFLRELLVIASIIVCAAPATVLATLALHDTGLSSPLTRALDPYSDTHNATAFGLSCPQQAGTFVVPGELPQQTVDYLSNINGPTVIGGEDCQKWFKGSGCSGAFETGSSALYGHICYFRHSFPVNRSIALAEPVIYVSMNYRVSAFGFLASQEVKDAKVGNLGLWDQRLALRWVQKYIHAFGGDPSKVTIWGESAGSMSVSLQMLAMGGNTEGLFRGAFMQSGAPASIGDITHGQKYYDDLVKRTGCTGSSDTLACLRATPYETLKAAVDNSPSVFSYQSIAVVWRPWADGFSWRIIPRNLSNEAKSPESLLSQESAMKGLSLPFCVKHHNVPRTEADLRNYLAEFFFPNTTNSEMDELLTLYPQDVTQGSPYDTGTQNAFTPQFKRLASILGDIGFQVPRRFFLDNLSKKQNAWSFCTFTCPSVYVCGSLFPALTRRFSHRDLTDFLIHFATNLDPNGGLSPQWPQYTTWSRQLMTLVDSQVINRTVTLDRFRVKGMELLRNLSLAHPL
ncbi:carotenoid ester lipase precursor [Lactarius indigo]|nr:carotenoid ester lipase precursor [Lactarius indigo]